MAVTLLSGPRSWGGSGTDDRHRTYKVKYLVKTTSNEEGPERIMSSGVLPFVGSSYEIGSDSDFWAKRLPGYDVRPVSGQDNEPVRYWEIDLTFSTKLPDRDDQIDPSVPVGDPLDRPQKSDGGPRGQAAGRTNTKSVVATIDKDGKPLLTSSHEPLRGPQVEFDESTPIVRITQNVPNLELALLVGLVNHVNSVRMWGFRKRCILFKDYDWSLKYYGDERGTYYFERVIVLEFDPKTFDRWVDDEGTMVLKGHWATVDEFGGVGTGTGEDLLWVLDDVNGQPPDKNNPAHFIRATDPHGNQRRIALDGEGKPALTVTRNFYVALEDMTAPNEVPTDDGSWAVVNFPVNPIKWKPRFPFPVGTVVVLDINDEPGGTEEGGTGTALVPAASRFKYFVAVDDVSENVYPVDGGDWEEIDEPYYAGKWSENDEAYDRGAVVFDGRLSPPALIHIQKYKEADLFALGIPDNID